MSLSEVTVKGHKFNIIVIDDVGHAALYSHRVPFRFPEEFEGGGWTSARDYMEYVNSVALKIQIWISMQYDRRGLTRQGEKENQYLSYIKKPESFLNEPFSMVAVTEANNLNKIVATLRVTRVGEDGLLPLERQQNIRLPREIIWDEMGIPIQGPPEELKGLVVDRAYRQFADWFNVLYMTVGPMVFVQELYSPVRQCFERTVPDRIYLECYRKMIPQYEKTGFRYLQDSAVGKQIVTMAALPDQFVQLPRLLARHRGTMGQLHEFEFTPGFTKRWMPLPFERMSCVSALSAQAEMKFYEEL